MVSALRGKVLVAKLGMDAHWRGAIVVANALRDAGMEVVYLGHASAAEVAAASVQEDAALVGLSLLSGNHLDEVPATLSALRAAGSDAVVVVGGAIPPRDAATLVDGGVAAVYPTGSPLPAILTGLGELLAARASAAPAPAPAPTEGR